MATTRFKLEILPIEHLIEQLVDGEPGLAPGLYKVTKSVANTIKFLPMRSYLNMHSPFATENFAN